MQLIAENVEDNIARKETFALHLLFAHGSAERAAEATAPDDLQLRLFIARFWPTDPYVLKRKRELVDEYGANYFLPTQYEIAHKLMEIADKAIVPDDKLKAIKQYTDVMGITTRGQGSSGVTINNSNTNVNNNGNRVLVLQSFGTDAQWEAAAFAQQQKLISEQ